MTIKPDGNAEIAPPPVLADPTKQAEAFLNAIGITLRAQQRRIETVEAENSSLRTAQQSEAATQDTQYPKPVMNTRVWDAYATIIAAARGIPLHHVGPRMIQDLWIKINVGATLER